LLTKKQVKDQSNTRASIAKRQTRQSLLLNKWTRPSEKLRFPLGKFACNCKIVCSHLSDFDLVVVVAYCVGAQWGEFVGVKVCPHAFDPTILSPLATSQNIFA
jgi:hypothetical protein